LIANESGFGISHVLFDVSRARHHIIRGDSSWASSLSTVFVPVFARG
jgi:hypothetical protein